MCIFFRYPGIQEGLSVVKKSCRAQSASLMPESEQTAELPLADRGEVAIRHR